MTKALAAAKYLRADFGRSDRDLAEWLREQFGRCHMAHCGGDDLDMACTLRGITLDYLDTDNEEMTWLQFVKQARAELEAEKGANEMTTSMERQKTFGEMDNATRLAAIEARIGEHMSGMVRSLLGVGRCLCEAKDANLVPHGEWEGWLTRVAGMTPRTAQRLMQAAREAPEGSAMALLPVSKIQALLALPESEREPMAQRAVDEKMTGKELDEAIRTERRRSEQLRAKYNGAIDNLKAQEEAVGRMSEKLRQQNADMVQLQRRYDIAHEASRAKNEEILRLREALKAAKDAPTGISPEAQTRIRDLEAEIERLEDYAQQQAQLRQEAQQQLLNAQVGGGRMETANRFGPAELKAAVNDFLGEAGVLVHMGVDLAQMDELRRREISLQIKRIQQWADGAMKAMRANVMVE